jgi:sterol desaturase/sphingolipid hydroxylase (fatty acid hydroxylase superfamily)
MRASIPAPRMKDDAGSAIPSPGSVDAVFQRYEDYETAALVVLALSFEVAERLRPGWKIDKKAHLRLDVVAVIVLFVAVGLSRKGLAIAFQPLADAVMPGLEQLRALPGVAKVLAAMVLADFTIYWIHRAMHKWELLWRTHEFHHSVENLWWFSGLRTSVLHGFLFAIPQALIPFAIFKVSVLEAGIGFSVGVFFQLWMHSNVNVSLGPLAWVIVTPEYHRIHHSATKHRDMNLGIAFAVWDRLFGTYVDPRTLAPDYPMGLGYTKDRRRLIVGV